MIREETSQDASKVREIVQSAFDQTAEADLVDALRAGGDATLSLVAEEQGEIVGHILFSRLQAPAECLALAPVSVRPDRQNRNIGSALIHEGLARAKRNGWQAVFVLGEPEYYQRFGFNAATAKNIKSPFPKEYFMAMELIEGALSGRSGEIAYAQAFQDME